MRNKRSKNGVSPKLILVIAMMLMISLLTGCASSPASISDESIGIEHEEKESPSIVPEAPIEAPEESEEMNEETVEESQDEPGEASEVPGEMVEEISGEIQGELIVEFIDVGQGDSILIISPDGKAMLIDAGDRGNYSTISQRLKHHKVDTIHALVATHPHADHIGSMSEVISGFEIEEIYMPDVTHTTKTFENMLLAIQAKGLGINTVKAGDKIPFGEYVQTKVVAPVGSPSELNDYSIVLHMTFGDNRFLFAGDSESGMESKITDDIQADVLKVGHHGSSTSTGKGFLAKVKPKHSVISVGAGNKYDHPANDTLIKLQDSGSKVYRTDEAGTITVRSDGKEIKVSSSPSEVTVNKPAPVVESTKEVVTPTPAPVVEAPKQEVVETPPAPVNNEKIVYGTDTGSKYHTSGCRYLKKSKIEMTMTHAKSIGLDACGVCNPGN